MKKLFLFCSILLPALCMAQTSPPEIFVLSPTVSQRVLTTDSVQVSATLSSNKQVTGITWAQVSGPSILKITPASNWYSGAVMTSYFWLNKAPAGTYVFKATGTSSSGTTGSVTDTITVVAAPTCPPPPAPRTVVSAQINIGGIWYPIPVGALKLGLSDGATQ